MKLTYPALTSFVAAMLQTFIKMVNYSHLMPTRYTLTDVDTSKVTVDCLDNSTKKVEAQKVRRCLSNCLFSGCPQCLMTNFVEVVSLAGAFVLAIARCFVMAAH
jgi:hypothetical protein